MTSLSLIKFTVYHHFTFSHSLKVNVSYFRSKIRNSKRTWQECVVMFTDPVSYIKYIIDNERNLYTPFLWYRGFYDTAVFILSVPMHCSATRRFFYLYIHKHNSHIYRNVWSFCPNVLNFFKYTYFYLFLWNSGHFYFTLIPCFVKCPIIKP